MREGRYAASLALSAIVAAGILSALFLFVWRAGWIGAAGIFLLAGIFLAWFYKGRRPDRFPGRIRRERRNR